MTGKNKVSDKDFKGPIKDRGCTDVICCLLITLYMIGMIIVGIIGFKEGDPRRLLAPTDSNGNVCGVDVPDKKFLHFFDLTKCLTKGAKDPFTFVKRGLSCPTPQVCVNECPQRNIVSGAKAKLEELICVSGTTITPNVTRERIEELITQGKCSPYYLESKPVFYRCLPTIAEQVVDQLKIVDSEGNRVNGSDIALSETAIQILFNLQNFAIQVADEIKAVWIWILVGFVISMLVSLLYIVIARWITFPLVLITQLGVLGLLGFSAYYTLAKYKELVDNGCSQDIVWRVTIGFDDFARNKTTWLVLGIISSVLTLILLLIIIFLFPRLRVACALIAEASRAVCSMLSTLFFPILPWLLQLAWFAWFLIILIYLMSNGTKMYQVSQNDTQHNLILGEECDPDTFSKRYSNATTACLFGKYEENSLLLYFQIFHLFGWLWGAQFIIAFAECTLAGAFASYYWSRNKPQDIPSFPVFASMGRTIRYHTGSLAFGAAIIAVVKLIRIILEYLHTKLKEHTDNPVANFIMTCLKCCFWCLEKILRFLNKNAYIMIAIYGRNFCASAREACNLLLRNPVRALVLNGVTGFLLFLGKVLVTAGIAVGSFYWFVQYNAFERNKLDYSAFPVIICTVGAYLVAVLFFNVYDMGIDTMFLSVLEDLERNNGKDKPYFMTKRLRKIMNVKNNEHTEME